MNSWNSEIVNIFDSESPNINGLHIMEQMQLYTTRPSI